MPQQNRSSVTSRIDLWAGRLNRLPRLGRVVLSLLITVELVALVSLFVDRALIDHVLKGDIGAGVPAWIEVGIGVVLYAIGWWLLVGFEMDPERPWQAGTSAVLYVALGAAGLVLILILALYGLAVGYVL